MRYDFLFIGGGTLVEYLTESLQGLGLKIAIVSNLVPRLGLTLNIVSYSEFPLFLEVNTFQKIIITSRLDLQTTESAADLLILPIMQNLTKFSKNFDVALFCSSVSVYGNYSLSVSEEFPTLPISNYAKLKLRFEREIAISSIANKFLILRIGNLYGEPRINGLFSELARSIERGEDIVLPVVDFYRNFVNIDDFLKFIQIDDVVSLKSRLIYNFASNQSSNVAVLVSRMIIYMESSSAIQFTGDDPEIPISIVDNTNICNDFHFHFVDIEETLKKVIDIKFPKSSK